MAAVAVVVKTVAATGCMTWEYKNDETVEEEEADIKEARIDAYISIVITHFMKYLSTIDIYMI